MNDLLLFLAKKNQPYLERLFVPLFLTSASSFRKHQYLSCKLLEGTTMLLDRD